MRNTLGLALTAATMLSLALPLCADITNGGFETGDFTGWTADANWKIMDNGSLWYSGWRGKYWAWSGGTGEKSVGKLTSKPFTLDKDAVQIMVSGWASVLGSGKPRRWNYVTLNLADGGKEIDRVYAPDATVFAFAILDCADYRGQLAYIQAVDDADQDTFSMLCIDDVKTIAQPASYRQPAPPVPAFDPTKSAKIEDERYRVEINRANGSITRIYDKKGGLELIREPRLAESFKFTLPIPGKEPWQTIEANYIIGSQQKLASIETEPNKITLHWGKPLLNYLGEKYDASAAATIELAEDGVVMNLRVDNRTEYQIGEIFFPMLGGVTGIGNTMRHLKTTQFIKPTSADSASSSDIFIGFGNGTAWGDVGPEQVYTYPKDLPESWVEFLAPKLNRSVYFGSHDPADREKVLRLEMKPGTSGTPREDGNWPRPEELRGEPVGVEVSFVHFANSPAGKTYDAAPVLVRFHDGDWHEGQKIYQKWKAK